MKDDLLGVRAAPCLAWLLVSACVQSPLDGTAQDESGEVPAAVEQAILNGDVPGPSPLAARVVHLNETCSGTLITTQWVLTAAHCLEPVGSSGPLKDYIVETRAGLSRSADWIQFHPQAPDVDVMLMHLSTPLAIQRTTLSDRAPVLGQALTCYGYGDNVASSEDGELTSSGSGTLRVAKLTVAGVDSETFTLQPNERNQIHLPGDSGGPCFDSGWNLTGVHHGATAPRILPPSSNSTASLQHRADRIRTWVNKELAGSPNDFNRDRRPDIVWHNRVNGEIRIWNTNGAWRVAAATVDDWDPETKITANPPDTRALAPAPWKVVGGKDFDGDGMTDMLLHNPSSGEIHIWTMSGASRLRTIPVDATADGGYVVRVGAPWSIVSSNDFNQDGYTDILWHNDSGETQIWYMQGSSRIARATVDAYRDGGYVPLVGAPWSIVSSNDFDRDGYPDILWHNDSSGETQIWYMRGSSRMARRSVDSYPNGVGVPLLVGDGDNWSIVGSADFDLDGSTDILWHNAFSDETQIWYMRGSSRVAGAAVADSSGVLRLGAPWRIANH